MKKLLLALLILIIISTGLYLLNILGYVSLQDWGEKLLTSTPVLKNYVQTAEAYHLLFQRWRSSEAELEKTLLRNEELSKELEKAHQEIQRQQVELSSLEEELLQLKEKQEMEAESFAQLVKIYSAMDPEEAALILANLDQDLVLKLLLNLKSEQAAAILSSLPLEKAAIYSEALVKRN